MRRAAVGLLVLMPGLALAQGQPTPLIPPSINYQSAPQDQSQLAPQDQPSAPIEASPLAPPPGVAATPEGAAQAPAPGSDQATGAPPAVPEQPAVSQWPNKWVPETGAVLQVLNKIDARSQDVTVKVGETADVGPLSIKVDACVLRPPDQPADAAAFLVISDGHKDEAGFQGWSLENEPWVSMLQNPEYNVRVVGCS